MDLKFIYFSIYNVLFCLSEPPPLCCCVLQHTAAHTHTPSPTSQLSIPFSPVWLHFLHVTVIVSLFFFFLIHAPIALITNSPSPSPSSLPPPPRHGPDHAADDHQRRRLQLPRSLFDPSSTTGAARTRVDREQAAAAHQTAGSATEPKNPALPPPPPHGPDHAADDHQRHRFQLPRSLFDPSITTEAQRAQIDRGGAATAHQATESTTKPPNSPLSPPPPPRPGSRRR